MKKIGIMITVALLVLSFGLTTTGCSRKATATVETSNTTLGQKALSLKKNIMT